MNLAVTPLDAEFKFLTQSLMNLGYKNKEIQFGKVKANIFEDLDLCIGCGGHGKVQFAIQTQFLLKEINANQVFCVGAAGGISDVVSTFDVVIGEKTIEHDYTCRFVSQPLPEFFSNQIILEKIRLIKPADFNLHIGTIASGDEDIVCQSRADEIQKTTNALAVAWEGVGGARSCSFLNVPFIEIRAITDMASSSAPVDFIKNLEIAMQNIGFILKQYQLSLR